jgi:hypothetical protein
MGAPLAGRPSLSFPYFDSGVFPLVLLGFVAGRRAFRACVAAPHAGRGGRRTGSATGCWWSSARDCPMRRWGLLHRSARARTEAQEEPRGQQSQSGHAHPESTASWCRVAQHRSSELDRPLADHGGQRG